MLHSRPSSSDAFQAQPQQYPQPSRPAQQPRSVYGGQSGSYRGASAAPVQPYAFQNTPHLRENSRTTSTPAGLHNGLREATHAPSPSTSSSDTSSVPSGKDDSVMGSRPGSIINLSPQLPDLSFTPFDQTVKSSPDRYRRPAQKRMDSSSASIKTTQQGSAAPSGSGMGAVNHLYQPAPPVQRQESVDDAAVSKKDSELAKRYRRRSLNTLDTQALNPPQAGAGAQRPMSGHSTSATSTPTTIRPISFQSQISSDDGLTKSTNASQTSLSKVEPVKDGVKDANKSAAPHKNLAVPPRGSSDASKRLGAPSPLSKQAPEQERQQAPVMPRSYASVAQSAVASPAPSAAAAQLAAVSDRDLNKGMKSRLRRALSFGSAQELRRAAGENSQAASTAQQVRAQHQQKVETELELDAEQQEIARRQEAAGIGAGIYSGQGGFSGSTDNLSISSTASSASMMLRKMGRGAKKSARSIKGLFRPKSVVGVPAADGPVNMGAGSITQPSVAQVSMVTVEAERHKVNVNAEASEKAGGGTGYPKLERNSIDTGSVTLVPERGSADGSDSRRSIVGSDKDRTEALTAIKKSILKRSGTGSPNGSPAVIPQIVESPSNSLPGTPRDGPQGRSSSLNGDYFSPRLAMTKSMPATPNGSSRNISFSPRIQFHDVWSSTEYDRRGEIATCNRLTPMLAQQIKEELNTFKMEMEVHEQSKPHTHFF
ncbi:bud neck involved protein [Recurvomyces mirabilis]|nr:bud neck involved protein [Recurvomyces mirabilis]